MALLEDFYSLNALSFEGESCLNFSIQINASHEIFNGHFPKFKVTPGVVMLQIVKNVLEQELHCKLQLQQASQVKFLNVVEPDKNSELNFEVSLTSEAEKISTKTLVSFPNGVVVLKCNAIFVKKT